MGFLLALTCALILYGTLYPFSFSFGLHEQSTLSLLIASANDRIGRGDAAANVILFLPFGFFAMQSILPRVPRPIRLFFVVVAGAALSLCIEHAQNYLPGRVVSIYDIAINTAGTLLGGAFGWKDWRGKLSKFRTDNSPPSMFPLLLFGAWLGSQLIPFVPTLDVQNIKNALKPLFFEGFLPLDALKYFIITMIVCRLVLAFTQPGRIRTALTFLPLAAIAVKPFIVGGSISQARVLGVLLGIIIWLCILKRIRRSAGILAFLLIALIVVQGLSPFVFNVNPGRVSFIPFIGFMKGSMLNNVWQFLEKIFLYGALLWLLIKTGWNLRFSLIFSVVLLAAIELTQMFQPGRVSETTDPALAVILAVFLYFLDLRDESS
jgi:VanZ family protein